MTDDTEPTRAEKRAAQTEQNRIARPDCTYPQYTALTSYQRGCRCEPCVEARRATSRKCQAAAYALDPEKFRARQLAYLLRKKAKKEDSDAQ